MGLMHEMHNKMKYRTGNKDFDKACRTIDCGYNKPKTQKRFNWFAAVLGGISGFLVWMWLGGGTKELFATNTVTAGGWICIIIGFIFLGCISKK